VDRADAAERAVRPVNKRGDVNRAVRPDRNGAVAAAQARAVNPLQGAAGGERVQRAGDVVDVDGAVRAERRARDGGVGVYREAPTDAVGRRRARRDLDRH
jgi:hypothetical protein